jgi:hypothetical protein
MEGFAPPIFHFKKQIMSDDKEITVEGLQAIISTKDESIATLTNDNSEKDAKIESLTDEIATKDELIEELKMNQSTDKQPKGVFKLVTGSGAKKKTTLWRFKKNQMNLRIKGGMISTEEAIKDAELMKSLIKIKAGQIEEVPQDQTK